MYRYGLAPTVVRRSSAATVRVPLKWQREAVQGLRQGHQCLVFTCSWSDFFIAEADVWRPEAWAIIRQTSLLTYQILTKRPERFPVGLPPAWGPGWPNVWLGCSVETQRCAEARIPLLLETPAAIRFLSCEPLLGPLDLRPYLATGLLHWVILGGESGSGYRPCRLEWIADLVQQCDSFGVPVFVKQDSALRPGQQGRLPDSLWQRKAFPSVDGLIAPSLLPLPCLAPPALLIAIAGSFGCEAIWANVEASGNSESEFG
jgi:protein gp37